MGQKLKKQITGPAGDGEENNTIIRLDRRRNVLGGLETLCWKCGNALGGCSWSIDFTPVEGWDAKPTAHNSYKVYNCPKFVRG